MTWHALAIADVGGQYCTAIVVGGALYDLTGAAKHFGVSEDLSSMAAIIDHWGSLQPKLAEIAAQIEEKRHGLVPLPERAVVKAPLVPKRIFCAASNFVEHAEEMGTALAAKTDSQPYIFMKADTSVVGPHEAILLPDESTMVDWEVELAAVIGLRGRDIPLERALAHVAAYTVFNDISARDLSRRTDFPFKNDWFRGKSYDTFGPTGPWLVPAALIPDPQNVQLKLSVNDQMMQNGNTNEMIFTLAEQIAYLSRMLTLQPGDMIATGTPTGVGMGRNMFLKPGDTVSAEIPAIGRLTNPVELLVRARA
ncbi:MULTISPECIES: fumarylacetoacetate hydrolase family protein [unclassified Beijerinckia]|uniref:fumarylacetoacetate hydrolase family protein n=1 Tax=unclassified Beijerinckia TaxID=2638183 RepID=UPI0008989A41|nr:MULTISPECIES: fumarylacetoacetate hydrolase family protein [unclassified Beijerinckia]MDH7799119.1 2,4-diketo-3-deoxy-L-fuconate hydrolase [Beijerinckia sp. GAS462]SED94472.1 2-keto-4-pentenoate hydratase/2-oxohepta-3-ene-1,7-dioic acid hydratase (catechol pathway) [Beijerinckia sp. 28-YEA-48]